MGKLDHGQMSIKLTLGSGKIYTGSFSALDAKLTINDDLIRKYAQERKIEDISDIKSCTIYLAAKEIWVDVYNCTIVEKMYIDKFYNNASNISHMRVYGVNIHVIGQNIENLQIDESSILLSDCRVKTFIAGIQGHKAYLSAESPLILNGKDFIDSLDIKDSEIKSIDLLLECNYFNIQNCKIEKINLYGTEEFNAKSKNCLKYLHLWEHSSIEIFDTNYKIEKLKVEDTIISKMIARKMCSLQYLEFENATVLDAYNFSEESFKECNIECWELISKSASNKKQFDKRAEAQYHIIKAAYENETGVKSILAKLLNFCTGFGYKPFRAFRALLIMIAVSWGLLALHNIISVYHYNDLGKRLIEMLQIAVTAIVGQSGLGISDGFAYWITFIEYIGTVIIFAMFVNALYIKYKD